LWCVVKLRWEVYKTNYSVRLVCGDCSLPSKV
jgi:hypothetical protein